MPSQELEAGRVIQFFAFTNWHPSTLRRWFRELDSSQPPFSFLRRTLKIFDDWMRGDHVFYHDDLPLSWPTVFPFLRRFWPLRI